MAESQANSGEEHEFAVVVSEFDGHYVIPPTVAMADDHYLRGVQAVKSSAYHDALFHFGKAVFLAPNEPLPYVARAEAYAHLYDIRSAISNYRKALTLMKDPLAADDLRQRLAQILDTQGIVCFQQRQYSLALRYAVESLAEKYHPQSELHKALYLIVLGDATAAETIMTTSLVHNDEVCADALVLLTQICINTRKDFASAKRYVEEALFRFSRHPRVLDAERFFDNEFVKFKQRAEGALDIDDLTKCILTFPEDASLYQSRALAYASKKMFTMAVQDLFSCITKAGGSNPAAVTMMVTILSTIADELVQVGDHVSAINYYSEALKWEEGAANVLLARGDCSAAIHRYEDALNDYKKVLSLEEHHRGALERLCLLHDHWGGLLYNEGKYDLAEAEFSKAIHYDEENPTVFYHRALSRLMLQQPELAVRDVLSCRNLGTADPEILKMIAQFAPGKPTPTVVVADTDDSVASVMDSRSAVEDFKSTESASRCSSKAAPSTTAGSAITTIEQRLNPALIRDFLKHSKVAMKGSVKVVFQPAGGFQVQPVSKEQKAAGHDTTATKPVVWNSSTGKMVSRLSHIKVSSPSRMPRGKNPMPQATGSNHPSIDEEGVPAVPPSKPMVGAKRRGLGNAAGTFSISQNAPAQFLFSSRLKIERKQSPQAKM
jgi:tetratricopeptide (TPR) repeat protein